MMSRPTTQQNADTANMGARHTVPEPTAHLRSDASFLGPLLRFAKHDHVEKTWNLTALVMSRHADQPVLHSGDAACFGVCALM